MTIEFVDLAAQYRRLKPSIDKRIADVLAHTKFVLGPEVEEFEQKIGEFSGARHAVGVSSGTDALLMALLVQDIGPGDAVFLPSFTFTATAEVVVLAGATPVFVDVDPRSFNLDAESLEAKVSEVVASGSLRARSVIAVDLFGLPADYEAIAAVADAHGLTVIADGAQSFGADIEGHRVGALAPVTCLSFFPAKPLGCYGDGGALLTNDDVYADRFRSLRAHGKGNSKYEIVRIGLNARLDTIQAAILLAKLDTFADELDARRRIAGEYNSLLKQTVTTPTHPDCANSAWAQYSILLEDRDAIAAALRNDGIPTAVYYPLPMHQQPAYQMYGDGEGSLPVSEDLCRRILSLPIHPDLDTASVEHVAASVINAVGRG
jgi:UDP-2-acetamido-2-deoxy-ribo-hexuluronate aminotransferase